MTAKPPEQCQTMIEVREGVDQVDRELVALLARRFGYMDAAARIKGRARRGRDEPRKAQVLDNVGRAAEAAGLDGAHPRGVERTGRTVDRARIRPLGRSAHLIAAACRFPGFPQRRNDAVHHPDIIMRPSRLGQRGAKRAQRRGGAFGRKEIARRIEIADEVIDQILQFPMRSGGSSGASGGLASASPFDHS